ncbi:Alpha/Beta hydrolase protein [Xylogone sp. PMI_703]|nr:Alpha/Beta hydrolase protein [Xylogone sp. PMI_703]
MADRKDITFPAIDGITLKGWFFSAGKEKGPCIILTPGLSALKEHFIDDFAAAFQKAGFHALVYDNRCFGASGGLPRFDSNPILAQDDYLDAFDYAASLPEVDPERIAYWGTSFSGGVAMSAAAIDHRVKAVVVQVPFVSGELLLGGNTQFLQACFQDRAHIRAGHDFPVTRVIASSFEEAEEGNAEVILPDTFAYHHFLESATRGGDWENKLTTMTLLRMLRFEPMSFIHRISPTPLLMVLGDHDVSVPTSHQLQAFTSAREPKQLHIIQGCGHFEPYRGKAFQENTEVQIKFLKQNL